jgi:hypothetical protein
MFKLNVADWVPWQTRIRFPPVTAAVRHSTGIPPLTLKETESGKISTAWASFSTQNWHCRETTCSPVMGISAVSALPVTVARACIVVVGKTGIPPGGTVQTGVGEANDNLPQADVKNINSNAPINAGREILFISKTSRSKIISSSDGDAGIP